MKWKIKATDPPKVREPYARSVLWALAGIVLAMVLMQLVRIDTLIPTIGGVLGDSGATWFVALVVSVEVFALPYLLQMKLSPLFRVMSGCFVVAAPLAWTCLAIWASSDGYSTGQLSSYVLTPGSWWLIALNLVWLTVSYWALWLADFNGSVAVLRKKR